MYSLCLLIGVACGVVALLLLAEVRDVVISPYENGLMLLCVLEGLKLERTVLGNCRYQGYQGTLLMNGVRLEVLLLYWLKVVHLYFQLVGYQ